MKPSELIKHVMLLTEEDLQDNEVIGFLNDGIAAINAECEAEFPFLSLEADEEPAIPETWQRLLLVVYASARVKQMDSSQFEYSDLYAQFEHSLGKFKTTYKIPEEYKLSSGFAQSDFGNDYYRWG